MDKVKQWVALTVVGALAIVAAGWVLLVSPKRSEASDLSAQASDQESNNAGQETKLAALKAQAKDLPREQAKLAEVQKKIPETAAVPSLLRALTSASDASDVEFVSLAKGAVAPLTGDAAAAVATPSAVGNSSSTSASASRIPLTIVISGGYFQVQRYLDELENLPRAIRVNVLGVTPGVDPLKKASTTSGATATSDGDTLAVTISAEAYMSGSAPTQANATTSVASPPMASGDSSVPAVQPEQGAAR